MYVDLGLSKDMVGAMRGSFGLAGILLGVAVGGYLPLRFGLTPALMIGGIVLAIGTMLYAIVPFAHDPVSFAVIMLADQFALSVAGIVLVAFMSSLTSLGYTATQYALLSSAYALTGKIFKGFSGLMVDGLAGQVGRMDAYALFFVACGLMGLPALALFAWLAPKTAQKPGV
jgi:PAT family beta-lactamase induction signal transducer AmpG